MIGVIKPYYVCPTSEIELISMLAYYRKKVEGVEVLNTEYTKDSDFLDLIIIRLFKKLGVSSSSHYLKNKYLYWSTQGAIYYLEANTNVQKDKVTKDGDTFEKNSIATFLKFLEANDNNIDKNRIDLVSVGSGDGEKDLKCLEKMDFNSSNNYFPIDISYYLMQIMLNRYHTKFQTLIDNIKPIVADFYDLYKMDDKQVKLPELFATNRTRIFTLFGQTIANYKENDLLKWCSSLMSNGDFLLIGFELIGDRNENELLQKYKDSANDHFLLQPLSLIPFLNGLLINPKKLLKFEYGEFKNHPDLSSIPASKSFVPTVEFPFTGATVHIAWSTKYEESKLIEYLKSPKIEALGLEFLEEYAEGESSDYYKVFALKKIKEMIINSKDRKKHE